MLEFELLKPIPPDTSNYVPVSFDQTFQIGDFKIQFNGSGAIVMLDQIVKKKMTYNEKQTWMKYNKHERTNKNESTNKHEW